MGRPFKINDCLQQKILHSQNDFGAIYLKIPGLMTSPRCREEAEINFSLFKICNNPKCDSSYLLCLCSVKANKKTPKWPVQKCWKFYRNLVDVHWIPLAFVPLHCPTSHSAAVCLISWATTRRFTSLAVCFIVVVFIAKYRPTYYFFIFFGTLTKPVTALDPLLLSSSSGQDRLSESENSAGCCFRACESRCCWPIVKFRNEDVAPFFLFIYLFIYFL